MFSAFNTLASGFATRKTEPSFSAAPAASQPAPSGMATAFTEKTAREYNQQVDAINAKKLAAQRIGEAAFKSRSTLRDLTPKYVRPDPKPLPAQPATKYLDKKTGAFFLGGRKSRKLGRKFSRCVKSVRKTIKARKGSSKESAAIAICTKSVLQTRGRTMKRYRKGRLTTQKKR
jgi:hypothetical protein